ncbi:stage II sporulation protein P [Paenibacillus thalictri]|uniref:Stage II sporulation protein P n=1 Tax=Paenibacillus thalictri TaxID=2527873 RepID=A0A4Q9DFY5_9BACL|nr:stage II sporulation protein P [Paenibacillus thalictri]TBL70430.1 stage II sporulation protein P [Paenibacillus thalictri]
MKWSEWAVRLNNQRKTGGEAGMMSKVFIGLMAYTFVFLVLLGILGYAQSKYGNTAPSSSMKGVSSSVSSQFFIDMMAMELPRMQQDRQSFTFSQHNVTGFLFNLLTGVNPNDPKTMLAGEVPGLSQDAVVLRKGISTGNDTPEDYGPKLEVLEKATAAAIPETTPVETQPVKEVVPAPPVTASPPRTAGKNIAFIYQSHNQESYLPELPGVSDPDKAFDAKTNVTLVGKRLAEKLEQDGIGAVHSETNYPSVIKDFKYAYSYKYSLKTLQDALAAHSDLKFYFDIHRDSQKRDKTTVTIDGKDYAQVYFIIGGKNPGWKENEQFAAKIHDALESKHPGISKGIHAKSADGNGVYNQNFSPNNVLIEVGGPYNSLEECYRTADLLAEAISGVILNVQKVDAPADSKDSKKQG